MFDKTQLAWSPSGVVSLMPARCHQAGLGGSSARHLNVPVACDCYRASPAPSLLPQLLSCRNVSHPCADSGASLTFLWVEPAANKTREFPWTKGSFWLERGGGGSVCVWTKLLVRRATLSLAAASSVAWDCVKFLTKAVFFTAAVNLLERCMLWALHFLCLLHPVTSSCEVSWIREGVWLKNIQMETFFWYG